MKTKTPVPVLYFVPQPLDNLRLAHLCGPLDENLRQISAALDLSIFRRGEKFIVSGNNAEKGLELLEKFYAQAKKIITIDEVQLALVEQRAASSLKKTAETAFEPEADVEDVSTTKRRTTKATTKTVAAAKSKVKEIAPVEVEEAIESPILKTRRSDLRGRTPHQNT